MKFTKNYEVCESCILIYPDEEQENFIFDQNEWPIVPEEMMSWQYSQCYYNYDKRLSVVDRKLKVGENLVRLEITEREIRFQPEAYYSFLKVFLSHEQNKLKKLKKSIADVATAMATSDINGKAKQTFAVMRYSRVMIGPGVAYKQLLPMSIIEELQAIDCIVDAMSSVCSNIKNIENFISLCKRANEIKSDSQEHCYDYSVIRQTDFQISQHGSVVKIKSGSPLNFEDQEGKEEEEALIFREGNEYTIEVLNKPLYFKFKTQEGEYRMRLTNWQSFKIQTIK